MPVGGRRALRVCARAHARAHLLLQGGRVARPAATAAHRHGGALRRSAAAVRGRSRARGTVRRSGGRAAERCIAHRQLDVHVERLEEMEAELVVRLDGAHRVH